MDVNDDDDGGDGVQVWPGRDGTHIDRDGDWQVQKFAIEWGMQI